MSEEKELSLSLSLYVSFHLFGCNMSPQTGTECPLVAASLPPSSCVIQSDKQRERQEDGGRKKDALAVCNLRQEARGKRKRLRL